MITKELVDYIKKSKGEGKTNEQIKAVLMQNTWLSTDVEEGFLAANPPVPMSVPTPPVLPVSNVPYMPPSTLNNYAPREIPVLSPAEFIKPTTGAVKVMPKKSHTGLILSIIFVLLLIATGASAYVFRDNLKTLPLIKKFFPAVEVVGEVPAMPPPVVVSAEVPVVPVEVLVVPPPVSNCDGDIGCLIAAASECQAISATISSTGPNPLIKTLNQTSRVKYEIKPSLNSNNCTLIYSLLSSSLTISDTNRKIAMAEEGLTSAQIDEQLKKMNDSFLEAPKISTTCESSTKIIVSYLTDQQNPSGSGGVKILMGMNSSGAGSTNTVTNTTSTGQKLVCTQTFTN